MRDLFLRGLKPLSDRSEREILEAVAKHIKLGGVFVSYDEEKPVAFAIVLWPADALEKPQVAHFYSEGSRSASIRLKNHVLDTIRKKGYNNFIAVNSSGAPDEVWTRLFGHKEWKMKPIRTVFEFEVVDNG